MLNGLLFVRGLPARLDSWRLNCSGNSARLVVLSCGWALGRDAGRDAEKI